MLSMMTSVCPALTAAPASTLTVMTVPGIGAVATSPDTAVARERSTGSTIWASQACPKACSQTVSAATRIHIRSVRSSSVSSWPSPAGRRLPL